MASSICNFCGNMHTTMIGNSSMTSSSHSIGVRPMTVASSETIEQESVVIRRSGNYQPPIWKYDYIQNLKKAYNEVVARDQLKEDVSIMLVKVKAGGDPLLQLDLIDTLIRLGLAYLFDDQIKSILNNISCHDDTWKKDDLSSTSLGFRLLRQYGYEVHADIFNTFKDENGSFKATLSGDIKGMLHLYETSYLLVEDENILEDARRFATKHLKEYLKKENRNLYLSLLINHALELPLHWRITRSEARWFIDTYEIKQDMSPLLALAKLDFNLVQSIHQDDLRYSSKWWRSTRLGEKLHFVRDRIMENFLWTIGIFFEPQFGYCRRPLTKIISLITIIDDVYDVYGTLDELHLFTNAIKRWRIDELEQLPYYMRICYSTLFNTINEIASQVLKEQGICIISYLKDSWADLCECYLLEAKWYHNNYIPTLEEYLENAHVSVSVPLTLIQVFFWTNNQMTEKELQCLKEQPDIIRHSAMIFRLADDLATSSHEIEMGDVPKSIQCFMHETGATEEDARAHIQELMEQEWKKLNAACKNSLFSDFFNRTTMNVTRMAMLMYQNGDHGHASQSKESIDRVLSLLIHPIPVP
ncbi:terpene synthase 10-like [Rutidosis leptorrhynchoides]|uniref:terpene synthase 10-like n=1 Tax=Rutidosis leptorrhynchoides TaxID=125765 RepID=UPI003A995606